MEKPGMDRRRKPSGSGLLMLSPRTLGILLPLLVLPVFSALWAQNSPGELRVLTETSPETPISGGFWTVTLLVDYPRPGELEVRPPLFPPGLIPDTIRREPRLRGNERWTVLEYRFLLRDSGRLDLGPFEISSPRGRTFSAPLSLDIEPARGEVRLWPVWESVSPRLAVGESLEFCLTIPGWDPRTPLPAPALLMPPVPPGCILEALDPRPGDREAGRALRLRLIPLAAGEFALPARTVRSGGFLLELPPLWISVFSPRSSGVSRVREGRP